MHIQIRRIIRKNIETTLRTPAILIAVLIAVGVGPVVVDGPTHTQ